MAKTAKLQLTHEKERVLVMQIVRFPEALSEAITDLVPNRITEYLYDITDIFNSFYVECPVRLEFFLGLNYTDVVILRCSRDTSHFAV